MWVAVRQAERYSPQLFRCNLRDISLKKGDFVLKNSHALCVFDLLSGFFGLIRQNTELSRIGLMYPAAFCGSRDKLERTAEDIAEHLTGAGAFIQCFFAGLHRGKQRFEPVKDTANSAAYRIKDRAKLREGLT